MGDGWTRALCPQCGWDPAVDEDGTCPACGCVCIGEGVEAVAAEMARLREERDRLAAENAAYVQRFHDCGLRWATNQASVAEPCTRLALAAMRWAETRDGWEKCRNAAEVAEAERVEAQAHAAYRTAREGVSDG